MKESTLKRVNKTIINYLSLMGMWRNSNLNGNNPIVWYFMNNIALNSKKINFIMLSLFSFINLVFKVIISLPLLGLYPFPCPNYPLSQLSSRLPLKHFFRQ